MSEMPVPSVEHLPQAVVVHVQTKELRKAEVDAICSAIDGARATAPSLPFVLDMARVTFAGSLALGVLVGLSQEFRSRQQPLVFAGFQKDVRQSIEISRMDRVLDIEPDVPTALRRFRGDT